jgi:prepilin signal peptidase PulO-like enzyme (type II secretory pathway)
MPLDDLSTPLRVLYAVWFAAVGGAIGSFLNVVVYRVPAGLGLVYPASHCPACKRPIRWHDNVPVLGWIGLRGRCRDCGARISARYPLVEALTAAMFLVLGWVDVLDGVVHPKLDGAELLGVCLYHLVLLCTLLAAALIEWDGHRLPIRVVVPALVVGLVAPVVWPFLHPVPVWQMSDHWTAGWADGLVGLAAGLAVGWAVGRAPTGLRRPGLVWTTACVGLMLGYQAVLAIAMVLLAILLIQALLARLRPAWPVVPPTAWLAVLTFAWALAWKTLG